MKSRPSTCSFPECEGKHYGNGLCMKHNKRRARHGDPAVVKLVIHPGTPEERFQAKINLAGPVPPLHPELGPCHLWTGTQSDSPAGRYGVLSINGQHVYVHRFAVERVDGPIPAGYEPDHLCEVKLCVRRDHLEVVTVAENRSRGSRLHWARRRAQEAAASRTAESGRPGRREPSEALRSRYNRFQEV